MSDTEDIPTYTHNIRLNSLGELERAIKTHKAANPRAHFVSDDDPFQRTVGVTDETSHTRWYVPLTRLLTRDLLVSEDFLRAFKSEDRQSYTAAYFNQ